MNTKTGYISIKDLNGTVAFKNWIKDNLEIHKESRLEKSNLLIYLDYIENIVKESDNVDQRIWSAMIFDLRNRLNLV